MLLFVGGNPRFRAYCDDVRENDYKGYVMYVRWLSASDRA